ncbi:transporter substrate-binding domain-containing protein [Salinimonas sp. HHU 13199]|uniref:Transporter substrate-binding domain-containing protein n=1 Tax=Salinimonas profundi TaxID=2729140 RepID=A0ABR8LKP5_9ALTE|nr:transporter substrate-binding domain-containing protein [Salinimonas profundi]MBD3586327.1 transporter substrate-binding domain-containing protein [Salinimonas profundi]
MKKGSWCFLLWICVTGWALGHEDNKVAVYTNDTPVLSEVDEKGNVSGFAIEVARQVIHLAGLEADVQVRPFARVLRNTQTRHWSMAPGLARTPAREADFHWITPILANQVTLYVRKDHPLNIDAVESVAIQRDDFRHSIATDLGINNVVGLSSWEQALEAVIRKRVDGMLLSPSGFKMLCHRFAEACSQVEVLNTDRFFYNYLALGKLPGNDVLAGKLRIAAERYKQSEDYDKLMKETVGIYAQRGFEAIIQNKILTLAASESRDTETDTEQQLWVLAEETPFFTQSDGAGNVTGYAAHLVTSILDTAGMSSPILITPWPRIMREMQVKPNVLTFALGRTPEREKSFHWITPVTRTRHGLFSKQGDYYASLGDVPDTKIVAGLQSDYRVSAAQRKGLKVLQFAAWEQALEAVQSGKADLVYASSPALHISCQAARQLCENLKPASPMKPVTLYLAMSKKHTTPYLAEQLRQAAMQVKDSSAYHQWAKQWSDQMNSLNHVPVHIDSGVVNLWAQD